MNILYTVFNKCGGEIGDSMNDALTNKEFWKDTAYRAVCTFAETAFGMITIGQAFTDINWLHIVSVSGVAAIATVLKCLYVNTKRVDNE